MKKRIPLLLCVVVFAFFAMQPIILAASQESKETGDFNRTAAVMFLANELDYELTSCDLVALNDNLADPDSSYDKFSVLSQYFDLEDESTNHLAREIADYIFFNSPEQAGIGTAAWRQLEVELPEGIYHLRVHSNTLYVWDDAGFTAVFYLDKSLRCAVRPPDDGIGQVEMTSKETRQFLIKVAITLQLRSSATVITQNPNN